MISRTSFRMLSAAYQPSVPRVLVTGCGGQLGSELVAVMRKKYGEHNVIASNVSIHRDASWANSGPCETLDVTNKSEFLRVASNSRASWIIHLAALVSGASERNPSLATDVNVRGVENALETAKILNCRVFIPSSIAAFGPTTPRVDTPDLTIQQPSFIYGVHKVYAELLGSWYARTAGVDFRSLRYPGVVSWKSPPGGGTTDWACTSYFSAVKGEPFKCFVKDTTRMPMLYIDDLLSGTLKFMEAEKSKLSQQIYNVNGVSFTPKEQASAIKKVVPGYVQIYEPDFRQGIADSWPESLDDAKAIKDWGWKPHFDLEEMTRDMIKNISQSMRS